MEGGRDGLIGPYPRDEAENLVPLRTADERAHRRSGGVFHVFIAAEGAPDGYCRGAFQNFLHHLVVDVAMQQQARGSAASKWVAGGKGGGGGAEPDMARILNSDNLRIIDHGMEVKGVKVDEELDNV